MTKDWSFYSLWHCPVSPTTRELCTIWSLAFKPPPFATHTLAFKNAFLKPIRVFGFFEHLLPWTPCLTPAAAAAAKSLQSCPILCNPIDGSPPGSPIPGILQARILEWVAISFSKAWKWKVKVKSLSRIDSSRPHGLQPTRLLRPWDFSRQEYWSGVPLPSPLTPAVSLNKGRMSQEPHIGKEIVNLKIGNWVYIKSQQKNVQSLWKKGKGGWMSKMRAGNQGREGEQSIAQNWSLKTKVARGKMPVWYPADFFFFFTTKYFNIQF